MNKIIAGGCSFTDKYFPKFANVDEPLDFKMWPEVIGEKLNCKVINTGKCGFGNHAIYHTTLNAIMNNKVDHVFVMWSEWTRQDFLIDNLGSPTRMSHDIVGSNYLSVHPFSRTIKEGDAQRWYNDSFSKNFPHKHVDSKYFTASIPNIKQLIDTNINYIYSMQVICEKLNIGYTACQAMDTGILASLLIKHPHLEYIKNFHGWPIDKKLGGFTMVDLLREKYDKSFKVSEFDSHPNEIGHKFIGNKMMEYANV